VIPRRGLLLLVLAWPATGRAWEHEGVVWAPADQPFAYEVSSTPVPRLGAGVPAQEIADSFATWTGHDCLDLQAPVGSTTSDDTGIKVDGRNVFSFEDPYDQVPGGALALTSIESGPDVGFTQDGVDYQRITEADVVFAKQVTWATDDAIDAGGCTDAVSFRSVALREVGHLLGLADACPQGATCDDPALAEATMSWQIPACDTSKSTLAPDDLHGLAALYGPYVSTTCGPEQTVSGSQRVFGLVPFDATCSVAEADRDAVDGATWDFGDGGTDTGLEVTHSYTTMGDYDLRVCFDAPALQACDVFDDCPNRKAYVVACTLPDPVVSWDAVDGATIQLVNDTPIPADGCFDRIQWTLYDSSDTLIDVLEEWEPTYTFPGPGDYRAVLELSGTAGYTSAETYPHVSGTPVDTGTAPPIGCGHCDGGGAGSAPVGLLIALAAALGARRTRCRTEPDV